MLRPHIFVGATVDNYMVGAFRGTPNGRSNRTTKMRSHGKRLPCMLPLGKSYLEKRIQFVHVDDVDEDVAIRVAGLARQSGALVTSDIDRVTERTAELAGAVTHAIFAAHVPPRLTGTNDLEAALRALHEKNGNVVVVTMGEHGAMAFDGERLYREPACAVHAVDTTGAGDVFRGGFIYALVERQPIEQVLRTANAAAAVSCTRLGALNGVPSLAEVREVMAANVRG